MATKSKTSAAAAQDFRAHEPIVGQLRSPIYGVQASKFRRPDGEGQPPPFHVAFTPDYFKDPPFVSLTIESPDNTNGLCETASSVTAAGFYSLTLNNHIHNYVVHYIAYGVVGYQDIKP